MTYYEEPALGNWSSIRASKVSAIICTTPDYPKFIAIGSALMNILKTAKGHVRSKGDRKKRLQEFRRLLSRTEYEMGTTEAKWPTF
jgi:hypothetical protein